MATTVDQAFAEFAAKITPTPVQDNVMAARSGAVRGFLDETFGSSSNMPILSTRIIGSASRKTLIRPVEDVDILAVFTHGQVWSQYQGNSQTFLYRVTDALSKYRVEVVGARGQVVRLFYDAPPHVEIAPVFRMTAGGYVLPSGTGGWLATDPVAHETFMNQREQALGGHLRPLVRMLKRWNRVHSGRLKSFHLEVMTQAVFKTLGADRPGAVAMFFETAGNFLHVNDPAGHSGDLAARLSALQELAVKESFRLGREHAGRAIDYASRGNLSTALDQWRIVFGDEFPA